MSKSCVVDTNVAMVANGKHGEASAVCVAACARALRDVTMTGHLFVDHGGRIVREYRNNLHASGQSGPSDAFLKWVLTHEWNTERVTQVLISPQHNDAEDFAELPPAPDGVRYDPADKKFLAVSAAHASHPPVLQALDSKWWGWRQALRGIGVSIEFVCEAEAAATHATKAAP